MTASINNTPTPEELELINGYARNPLSAESVYCFSLKLCDNEVDRDLECFSDEALEKLASLFVGKTGISDHTMSADKQKARIFKTYLEKQEGKKTSYGRDYLALMAKAYMLITEENKEMIEQIEGGIKKEVSVGCSLASISCSICGKDMKSHECKHIKGKRYGKKLCYGILSDARDAYEWSFVAVPAQKEAGVTKSFKEIRREKTLRDTDDAEEMALFDREYVKSLEKKAQQSELYRQQLISDIKKHALISMGSLDLKSFLEPCREMDINALKSLSDTLRQQAARVIPVSLQLKGSRDTRTSTNNNSFKI